MKILFKTTAGRTTEADFPAETSIGEVKATLKDEYDVASLRLCFQGKILEDAKTVGELGEGAALFIAGKKAAISKPSTGQLQEVPPVTQVQPNPGLTAEAAPSAELPQGASAQQASVVAPTSSAPSAPPAREVTEVEVSSELIANIAAMGFEDTDLVKLALRAAYMNPDRAVDYLCNGTPRTVLERLAAEASPAQTQANVAAKSEPVAGVAAGGALQAALSSIPNFDQIRQVVQQNPASLPTFMQQLQQNHPEIFALVQENPQEFLELLQGRDGGVPASHTNGQSSVELTHQDQVAIQELAEVGGGAWDLQAAAIVYIAVNKNKEVAAAVLFEHGGLPPQLVQAMLNQQGDHSEGDDEEAEEF